MISYVVIRFHRSDRINTPITIRIAATISQARFKPEIVEKKSGQSIFDRMIIIKKAPMKKPAYIRIFFKK